MSTWRIPVDGEQVEIEVPDGWHLVMSDEIANARAAVTLLSDLDRCEHGRHVGDVCGGSSGCNGPSHGNPFLEPGQRIGTTLSAQPIIIPDVRSRASKIWRVSEWR